MALGTALVTMAASTALVGVGLIGVGEPPPLLLLLLLLLLLRGYDPRSAAPPDVPRLPSPPHAARLRLAGAVQNLPLPVVGGYLG